MSATDIGAPEQPVLGEVSADQGSERRAARGDMLATSSGQAAQWAATIVLALCVVFGIIFPAPIGTLVTGAISGAVLAMISFGLILIYRTNRIINFAQGDLGAVGGLLGILLIARYNFPFFLSMLVGIIAALMLGAFAEFVFMRRFAKAPRLIATVATLGVAQLFQGGQLLLPQAFGRDIAPQITEHPLDVFGKFRLRASDPVILRGAHFMALITVAVVCIGLAWFLKKTRAGSAVRASAESAERAGQLGIPVKRLNTLVWVIAAFLSSLALFLRAPIEGVPIGTVQGPKILLLALGAAVIGRMESMPITLLASIVIGMLSQSIGFTRGPNGLTDAIIFGLILAAFLLQRRQRTTRADDAGASSWDLVREVRPIPAELKRLPSVQSAISFATVAVLGSIIVVPLFLTATKVDLFFAQGAILAMLGISLVVLTGWAGEISLGQIGFFGLGAAVGGRLSAAGWDFIPCVAVAAVVGALASTLIGIPALRIRGPFLAVATLGFAAFISAFVLDPAYFRWLVIEARVSIERPVLFGKFDLTSDLSYYYFLVIMLGLVIFSVRSYRRSRPGRALIASRDNARAAQSYGISVVRARLTAFAFSGFIASMAGALFVFKQGNLARSAFVPLESITLFTLVVVGGLGSMPGVILGAAYFSALTYLFQSALSFLFVSGFGLLIILLVFPGGFGGIIYDLRDGMLRYVARRRGIVVASLLADRRTAADEEAVPLLEAGADAHVEGTRKRREPVAPIEMVPSTGGGS